MMGYIFELTRSDWQYKGILFAEMDHLEAHKKLECPYPVPHENYVVGILALIWVDEKGAWHAKMRLKFPSGIKQSICRDYETEFKDKVLMNETYVLHDMNQMPMKNKRWYPNPDGTIKGILNILEKSDMIETYRVIGMKDE